MGATSLVDHLIDDGKKIVEHLPQSGFELTAAFWLQKAENGEWYFYVVSPAYEVEGPLMAYSRLLSGIRQLDPGWIDPAEIRLLGPANPIARDVLALLQQPSAKLRPMRWGYEQFGNLAVEGAYLYPLPAVASR